MFKIFEISIIERSSLNLRMISSWSRSFSSFKLLKTILVCSWFLVSSCMLVFVSEISSLSSSIGAVCGFRFLKWSLIAFFAMVKSHVFSEDFSELKVSRLRYALKKTS